MRYILWLVLFIFLTPAFAADNSLELPVPLRDAMELLRSGRYRQAAEAARKLELPFPDHPIAPLIQAEAEWGLIFCQTGHINSHELWNESTRQSSSFDHDFFAAADRAFSSSDKLRRNTGTAAAGAFYKGLTHAVRARLFTMRAQALKSATEGKQMRASLLEAIEHDPLLQPDANAGLGAYNYYADVLSPVVKMFRFFLRIPGGDREQGLEQLHDAAQHADLLGPEARYELARIFSTRENRPIDAFALFADLAEEYPGNTIFLFSAALEVERIGNNERAIDYAQRATAAAEQMDDVCRRRLEPASRQLLERVQKKQQQQPAAP